ncbi:hypothetical protein [Streptomyces sp. NPDC058486]|uniref:hypothetical protein n=1 Tax=unclassified Streptomyces TaxID=2593676 RepID=UPI003665D7C0
MTEEAAVWNRLAALLPEAGAEGVRDCWSIGEQEAGLALLVSGLLAHQVPISETVRAEISVIAEGWGERETLTPQLLQCRGDGKPSRVRLVEAGVEAVAGADVLVPWIACERCGRVLARAHTREPWGLSLRARSYVITSPTRDAAVRQFPADSADPAGDAFATLLASCAQHATDS